MKYNIVRPGTNDVIIGPVGPGNAYLTAYPRVHKDSKSIADLEVGEHAVADYGLSGGKGTYWIVRIE